MRKIPPSGRILTQSFLCLNIELTTTTTLCSSIDSVMLILNDRMIDRHGTLERKKTSHRMSESSKMTQPKTSTVPLFGSHVSFSNNIKDFKTNDKGQSVTG